MNMQPGELAFLGSLKSRLLEEMYEFMLEADSNYDESDIETCDEILDQFLSTLADVTDKSAALDLVKQTVFALNSLNEACNGDLIETDQRESICELINRAGAARGFNSDDEDVTERWREW